MQPYASDRFAIFFRVQRSEGERLRRIAEADERPIGQVVRRLVLRGLDEAEREVGLAQAER